jgi:hypothetical protein
VGSAHQPLAGKTARAMIKFILKHNLYVMAALGVLVAIYVGTHWQTMTVLQRMSGLFFIGLVLHL